MSKAPKPRRLPALEFKAAAWVWEYWSGVLIQEDKQREKKRKAPLAAKAPLLQKAIARGIGKSAQEVIPSEIVQDEYSALTETAKRLLTDLRTLKSEAAIAARLRESIHDYGLTLSGKRKAVRRLWLVEDEDGLTSAIRDILAKRGGTSRAELQRILVGHMFGLNVETVKKKVRKRTPKRRFWPDTTPAQRFLVASFAVAARSKLPNQKRLVSILEALHSTGYPALGIYHLVKWSSAPRRGSKQLPLVDVDIAWNAVNEVCRLQSTR